MVRRFFVRVNMRYGLVTLFPIAKGHCEEVLMVTFSVRVHDCIGLSESNRAQRLKQIEFLHVRRETCNRPLKIADFLPWLQIEAGQHVEHSVLSMPVASPLSLKHGAPRLVATKQVPA